LLSWWVKFRYVNIVTGHVPVITGSCSSHQQQSHEATRCYEKFRTALGSAVKIFPDAIKEETELLVRIDDIIDEISMIKRVHEDQDHVCVALRIHHNMKERTSQAYGTGNNDEGDPRAPINARHEAAMEKGLNDLRSPKSQHMVARLKRLEEDAMRVRNSVSIPWYS
jgi:uncharacterized protein with von Willebrand factor type A (vWA) domain